MGQSPNADVWARRLDDLAGSDLTRQAAAYGNLRELILRCLGRARLASLGDEAEDFIQDRITDLATRKVEIRSWETFEPFVGKIVRTRFIDKMRQGGRRREWLKEFFDVTRFLGREKVPESEPDPAAVKRLREALRALDAEASAIVELRRIKGWTLKRTAEHLGISISQVHQREKKIVGQLASAMEEVL